MGMAYTDGGFREARLAEAAALKTGSNHGTFQPGYQPVVIRAVAALITTAQGSNDANCIFTKRDLVTGSSLSTTTMTLGSGLAAGKVVYRDGLDIELSPSQDIVVSASGNANGAASFFVAYEPAPEVPANNTDMTEVSS